MATNYSPKAIASALYQAGQSGDAGTAAERTVELLQKAGQMSKLEEVIAELQRLDRAEREGVMIHVYAPGTVDTGLLQAIESRVKTDLSLEKATTQTHLDESITSGIRVEVLDFVWDMTADYKLKQLRNTLTS